MTKIIQNMKKKILKTKKNSQLDMSLFPLHDEQKNNLLHQI